MYGSKMGEIRALTAPLGEPVKLWSAVKGFVLFVLEY